MAQTSMSKSSLKADAQPCGDERQTSLKCIEKFYDADKEERDKVCQFFFAAYKECKKKATEERNLKNNHGKKANFFPW